ncbi:MAG TPA: hypothetical protein PKE23_04070 [Anaerolineales bacterium]|nr:hypothetical protein [Anaerolineales bacterium]
MKTDHKKVYELLMDRPIAFQRIFKTITGSTVAALFLSQAYYWSKNTAAVKRGGWFAKPAHEWEEETGLTRREQETARRICVEELKIIEEKKKRWNKHATLYYRVNNDRLLALIEKAPSLYKSAKLASLADSAKLLDCTNPPNYLTEITRDYPPKKNRGGIFKTWKETPKEFHPYFEACTSKPISLPDPKRKEINAWVETFTEWIEKGFTVKQVIDAANEIRKLRKAISRPGSITWKLNDLHGKAHGQEQKTNRYEYDEIETKLLGKSKRQ